MRRYISTLEELKNTERIIRNSKSYVPVFTSSIISEYEKLNSNFKYALAYNSNKYSSCQVVLDNNIVLENSFDGTKSFSIKYNLGEFIFGNFRLIHRGTNAKDFNQNSEFFVQALNKYNKFYKFLEDDFDDKIIQRINEITSKMRNRKIHIEYTSKQGRDVLNHLINSLKEGNYQTEYRMIRRQGRKVRGITFLFNLQNAISKMLIDEFAEYFI